MPCLPTCTPLHAYVLSWLSLVLSFFCCGLLVVVGCITGSASALGFALENGVDFFSSALVLWRFWGGGKSIPEHVLDLREKRASVGIAFAFVALALVVGATSASHLIMRTETSNAELLNSLAVPSLFIFLFLGLAKLWVGVSIDSPSLRKDALCSFCGALLAFGVLAGTTIEHHSPSVWYIDACVALIVSVGLLIHGIYTLFKNAMQRNRWWRPCWWRSASTGGVESMFKGGTPHKPHKPSHARAMVSPQKNPYAGEISPAPFGSPPPRRGAACVAIGGVAERGATPSTTSTTSTPSSEDSRSSSSSPEGAAEAQSKVEGVTRI